MNVEFHYYSTAFLAVKAGFSLKDAATLAFSSQYVDHHRAIEVRTEGRVVAGPPTQNYSFWDAETVASVLAPFHFFPAGEVSSVRSDGRASLWDVRPNAAPVRTLLVEALQTRDLYRIGIALHTFADTWAHQNFTARDEDWNRLNPRNRLPAPGHAHAGWQPDLWLSDWTDSRLNEPQIVNAVRFSDCARKIYRYLCVFLGKDFKQDEDEVSAQLRALIEAGRGRESVDDRMVEFVLALNLEPYDRTRWLSAALEPPEETPSGWPLLDRWKKAGEDLLDRAGLAKTQTFAAKPGFDSSPLAAWMRAADAHRAHAKKLIGEITGGRA